MSGVSVEQLAKVVGTTVDHLQIQLADAGIPKTGNMDIVSDAEKVQLLGYLRQSHGKDEEGAGTKKITLRRKRVSELKVGGKGQRTINVEVRGKKTYVKRPATNDDESKRAAEIAEERIKREAEAAELEKKRLEAEAVRKSEEESRQKKKDAVEQAGRDSIAAEQAAAEKLKKEQDVKEASAKEATQPEQERGAKEKESTLKSVPDSPEKPKKNKKAKKKQKFDNGDEQYEARGERKELHVSKGKTGRSKKKLRRGSSARLLNSDNKHAFEKPMAPIVREVKVPEFISVTDLANKMSLKSVDVIKKMMTMGEMVTINQLLEQDMALLVVEEFGHIGISASDADIEQELEEAIRHSSKQTDGLTRAPIVTVMGHVDHGKTSLLDYIRNSRVTSGEAGGITQHIGAYHVTNNESKITFLDTPGHSAFTAMRARGAKITDIVILIVAADDGVMPQTIEAIQHAQAAEVPIIVAVNKIDKPDADPDKVKNELSKYNIIPEDWGGDTQVIHVSAHTGEGIPELLDSITLQAEIMELKATFTGSAAGVVVEASLEVGRGPVATILVQSGQLTKGDIIVCGAESGRVRAMFDESGQSVTEAGPSIPVQVLGLTGVPLAGDEMLVAKNERKAKELAELRQDKSRTKRLAGRQAANVDDFFAQVAEDKKSVLNVVIKADVQGSFEALSDSLNKISNDEITIRIVGGGVGGINESDAQLAIASDAIFIGFNVRADASARQVLSKAEHEVYYYSIIYDVIDQIKSIGSEMLPPKITEKIIGLADVKDVFRSSKFGAVAGTIVVDGAVKRNNPIRVLRDNVVIFEGELESLRRFKDSVDEVRMGTECGIAVKNYNDVKVGDQIEVFEVTEVARKL